MPCKRKTNKRHPLNYILGNQLDSLIPPALIPTCIVSRENVNGSLGGLETQEINFPSYDQSTKRGRSESTQQQLLETSIISGETPIDSKKVRQESPGSRNGNSQLSDYHSLGHSQDDMYYRHDTPLFLSELGMKQRLAEKNLESIIFTAETISKSSDIAQPLLELLVQLERITFHKFIEDAQAMGSLREFICIITCPLSKRHRNSEINSSIRSIRCLVELMKYICTNVPIQALPFDYVFRFFVDVIRYIYRSGREKEKNTRQSSIPLKPQNCKKKHWSELLKSPPPKKVDSECELRTRIDSDIHLTMGRLLQQANYDTLENNDPAIDETTIIHTSLDTLLFILLANNRRNYDSADDSTLAQSYSSSPSDEAPTSPCLSDSLNTLAVVGNTPLAVVFHNVGGLSLCLELLELDDSSTNLITEDVTLKVTQLLEAVSSCTKLGVKSSARNIFTKCFSVLFNQIHWEDENCSQGHNSVNDHKCNVPLLVMQRLRICINITSVCPEVIPTDEDGCLAVVSKIVGMLKKSIDMEEHEITDSQDEKLNTLPGFEVTNSCICLMINCMKKGENETLKWVLLNYQSGEFSEYAAGVAHSHYISDDPKRNIIAGYMAILIAMVSVGDSDARVAVITGLSKGAAVSIVNVQHKPMLWIVAILQEFVLFQSAAQVLTKETVTTMYSIIKRVMDENDISVTTEEIQTISNSSGSFIHKSVL